MADMTRHRFRLDGILVDPSRCVIERGDVSVRAEPKVMDVLLRLVAAEGEVVSRQELYDAVWPDTVVGDDTLSRTVSKLRRALGEDPKQPRFVETVPKRGYRLMVDAEPVLSAPKPVSGGSAAARRSHPVLALSLGALAAAALVIAAALNMPERPREEVELAKDRYMQFTRTDNEAAISLYERVLSDEDPPADAEAGMAAALVQRVVRWPETLGADAPGVESMSSALAAGLTELPEAQDTLRRARMLAERSVRRDPGEAEHWRVLGLVRTAEGDIAGALESYDEGLRRDPEAWGIRINQAELLKMNGQDEEAYKAFIEAYEAMDDAYREVPQRVGRWLAPLGVTIARMDEAEGRYEGAESWYRRTLEDTPLDREATLGLVTLLKETDRGSEARKLCTDYERRTGIEAGCGG
jgi:DNA-binding winged helix-turn-helix (wHTH) protein/Tfp pilus assembly protein PilF